MTFSTAVADFKLAAFPCFPQTDEMCVRAVALIFCVDHRASNYLTYEQWNWVLTFLVNLVITKLDKVLSD